MSVSAPRSPLPVGAPRSPMPPYFLLGDGSPRGLARNHARSTTKEGEKHFSPADDIWWHVPLSRQSTGESTVATEADLYRTLMDGRPSRLATLPEKRGWRYFFTHTMLQPIIFVSGIVIGMVVMRAINAMEEDLLPKAPYAIERPPQVVPLEYMASAPLNNSCLNQNLEFPPGPQTFDACGFVIKSTDEVWNLRGDVDAAIEKYFHEGYYNAGSWGRRGIGKKALREAVYGEMRAFPDIKIHITDCVCRGNDINGYKCAMPDVLTGTNTGPSAWGPATGRYARWTGLVQSLVKKNPATGQWQYYAEWGVHDEWALLQQLGLDFTRIPHPETNWEPLHDCDPLFSFSGSNGEPVMNLQDRAIQRWAEKQQAGGV